MLLEYSDLAAKGIRYSRQHLDRLEKDNRFPRRIKISANRVVWSAAEIDGWIASRAAERETA